MKKILFIFGTCPEAVEAGTVKLVETNVVEIIKYANLLLENNTLYRRMSNTHNPYGDRNASKRIVDFSNNYFRQN